MVATLRFLAWAAVDAWVVMLLAGCWHQEITPAVPALSFRQAVLVSLTVTFLAFYWAAPIRAGTSR